jgi:hypothetical protein
VRRYIKKWGYIFPIFLFPLIFYIYPIISGKALFWGTPSLQFVPWQTLAWTQFDQGSIPLWNPYNGMGAPLLANYQVGFFYPPNWLLYFFFKFGGAPVIAWGYSLLIYFHLVWAGIGMYLLTSRLGLKPSARMVSSLAFAGCSFLITRSGFYSLVFTAVWIPWVIWAISKIASPIKQDRSSSPFPIVAIIVVAFQLLAGHAQMSWYTAMLAFIWVTFGGYLSGGFKKAFIAALKLLAVYLIAILLTSIQILPTLEYLRESQRSAAVEIDTALSYSYWPWRLITMFAPDLFGNPGTGSYWGYGNYWEDANYIGMLPILLAISTFFVIWRKKSIINLGKTYKPLIILCWITMFLVQILALGRNTPVFPFLYHNVPTFALFNGPTRFMILVDFLLCLLAGIAVQNWTYPTGKTLRWLRSSIVAGFAVTIGAFAAWIILRGIDLSIIKSVMFAGFWGVGSGILALVIPRDENSRKRAIWQWGVVAWIGIDLIIANISLIPIIDSNFYNSNASKSQISQDSGRVYMDIEEDHLLKFNRFVRFRSFEPLEEWQHLREIMIPNLNILDRISYVNNFDPFVPARFARLMEFVSGKPEPPTFMNIGTIISRDTSNPLGVRITPLLAQGRIRWYSCAKSVPDEEASWNLLISGKIQDNEIVIEVPQSSPQQCYPNEPASINIINDKSQLLEIELKTKYNGWLFVADIFYPGWYAEIDGVTTEILRANFTFRAIFVPSGSHNIRFYYSPQSFFFGTIISIVCCIMLFGALLFLRFKKRHIPPEKITGVPNGNPRSL